MRASSIRIEFDLVDNGIGVPALHHVLDPVLHIVAQVIEAELVVGAVGDVAVVMLLARFIVEAVYDDPDRESEECVNLAHPFGVARGEIIVDGDDVNTASGQRIEIDRKGRDQRLALAGLHLGDLAFMHDHAADELDIEMPLAERAFAGFTHGCESRHQNVIKRLALGELFLELLRARPQRLVGKAFQLLFQSVDFSDAGPIRANTPVVGGTE